MLCDGCRQSLERVESFIQGMKTAILEEREEAALKPAAARWWEGFFHPLGANLAWGGALATLILIAMVEWPSGAPLTPAPIALTSFRGSREVSMARGPAGRPLELSMDAAGIDNGARCRVEGSPLRAKRPGMAHRIPRTVRSERASPRVCARATIGSGCTLRITNWCASSE